MEQLVRTPDEIHDIAVEVVEDVVNDIGKREVWSSLQTLGYELSLEEHREVVKLIERVRITVDFDGE